MTKSITVYIDPFSSSLDLFPTVHLLFCPHFLHVLGFAFHVLPLPTAEKVLFVHGLAVSDQLSLFFG